MVEFIMIEIIVIEGVLFVNVSIMFDVGVLDGIYYLYFV